MRKLSLAASLTLVLAAAAGQHDDARRADNHTVSFQQGVNGYAGTTDIEIWAVAPNTCLEGNPNASSDSDNDGGESQVLLRFAGIVGDGPGQVPPRSSIHTARLVVSAFDPGTPVHLHRMLVPWKRTATWNSLVAGITADGLEASSQKDSFTFGHISASSSEIVFEVTDTVQAWVNGAANHGWVFINTGPNGWDFYTSEFEDVKQRGLLDSTLVVVNSEFGRTPKINAGGGRDHWPRVFSIVLAGGGIKRGQVYGASDALAAEPAKTQLSVEDYAHTVYHLLGIDATKDLMSPGNRPQQIVMNGKVVKQLLA